ncbi:prolyl 4- beta polypeptide, putative, partial [Ichthyophthirius multifiliis]
MAILNFISFVLVIGLSAFSVYFVNKFDKSSQTEKPYSEESVWVLNDSNFDDFVKSHDYVLAEFYAPWCGHCKQLAPEYAKAAYQLEFNPQNKIYLAKIDATQNPSITQRFQIQGYPTLKYFSNGNLEQPKDYNGGRTAQEIISWVTKKSGPPSQLLKDKQELDNFISSSQVSVVYFGNSETEQDYLIFQELAQSLESVQFGHVLNSQLKKEEKAQKVVLYKQFDEKRNDFSEKDLSVKSLTDFIQKNDTPLLLPFNNKAIEKIFEKHEPAIIIFIADNDDSKQAEQLFGQLAQKQKKEIQFIITKFDDGQGYYDRLAEYLGVDNTKNPSLMIVQGNKSNEELARYKFEEKFTEKEILNFIQNFKNGKLQRFLKSQDIPEPNPEEKVVTLVGKNFKQVVLDGKQDVLVEFYAPWCGHCKALAPKYESIAKQLAHNKNLIIAKVDSTSNDIPGIVIQSFPTIKFFKNSSKDTPIDYDGKREEQDFLDWLEKNVSYPWEQPRQQVNEQQEQVNEQEEQAKKQQEKNKQQEQEKEKEKAKQQEQEKAKQEQEKAKQQEQEKAKQEQEKAKQQQEKEKAKQQEQENNNNNKQNKNKKNNNKNKKSKKEIKVKINQIKNDQQQLIFQLEIKIFNCYIFILFF